VGKSSLFNLLTEQSAAAENYPFCTIEPNEARCPVPDARYVGWRLFIYFLRSVLLWARIRRIDFDLRCKWPDLFNMENWRRRSIFLSVANAVDRTKSQSLKSVLILIGQMALLNFQRSLRNIT
jgi:hypothetical protein